MKLFFDTEFTGLHKDTTLISLGIVAENGEKFYAEFTDYDKSQCDDWIKENVLHWLTLDNMDKPFTTYGTTRYVLGTKNEISIALRDWLRRFETVEFVSDVCHYDFVLLIDLFGSAFDLPSHVSPACTDLNTFISTFYCISNKEAFDKSREEIMKDLKCPEIFGRKHNALYDAEVIKAIYMKMFGTRNRFSPIVDFDGDDPINIKWLGGE